MQSSSGGEGGRKWKPEGGGDIIRRLFASRKTVQRDPRMEILLDVGYLLSRLKDGRTEFKIVGGAEEVSLCAIRYEEAEDSPEWIIYVVQTGASEAEYRTVFTADFADGEITFDYEPGNWEGAIALAYAVVRDEMTKKLPCGDAATR
jgi:hypothetical protein